MAVLLGLFWNLFRPTGCLQCTIVNGVRRSHIRLVYFHREFRCDGWFTITSWLWCIVFTGKWYIQTDRSDFAAWPGPSIWRHVLTSTAGRNGNLPPLGESVMRIIISLPAWCRTIHHTASPALHNAAGHQFACTSWQTLPMGESDIHQLNLTVCVCSPAQPAMLLYRHSFSSQFVCKGLD